MKKSSLSEIQKLKNFRKHKDCVTPGSHALVSVFSDLLQGCLNSWTNSWSLHSVFGIHNYIIVFLQPAEICRKRCKILRGWLHSLNFLLPLSFQGLLVTDVVHFIWNHFHFDSGSVNKAHTSSSVYLTLR